MQAPDKKKVVVIGFFLVMLCFAFASPDSQISSQENTGDQSNAINMNDNDIQPLDEVIIEGEPVFITSAPGDDYVDSVETIVYGSHSTAPPSGMGVDSTTSTVLTESSYSGTTWTNKMTQTTFNSIPSGWTDSTTIAYSGGDFMNPFEEANGFLYCSPVSTTGCDIVRFTISSSFARVGGGALVVSFYDSTSIWDNVGTIPVGDKTDHVFSKTDSQYKHANFRVKIEYSSFDGINDMFAADNWRIDVGDNYSGNRVSITYKFTGVDYNSFFSEYLYVDFDIITSLEYFDFRFESGDPTPDYLVGNHQRADFNVDIHPYLSGSECYVNIRDEYQLDDGDSDTWRINRMYIRLTNAIPQNDQTPACTNLDDTDNLYARNKLYAFSTSVYDGDGYSHIDYVELTSMDTIGTSTRWSVRFDEDTNTFSEEYGDSIITLTGSSFVKTGNSLDVTFRLYIEWEHPDTTDDSFIQYVRDATGASDWNSYSVNYDYETRLDMNSNTLDDGSGTSTRGDINGAVTASGTVTYLGSNINPPSDQVDVWAGASLHSGAGPWSDTTLVSGDFSLTVYADDQVGFDTFWYSVVPEGAGSGGTDQLHFSETNSYISDRVEVQYITSNDNRININQASDCYVRLYYEYDDSHVTDGTVTVNGIGAAYSGGAGIWSFNETKSSVQLVTYNSVAVSSNSIGITEVNENGQSLNQIWDQIIVSGYSTPDSRVNIGTSVGVYVTINYEYDDTAVTDGMATINGLGATHISDGQWQIIDSESIVTSNTYDSVVVSGNALGITVVDQNSQSITVIWDSVTLTLTNPVDQRINIDENATGIIVSGVYDFDSQPFDGTFSLNSSVFSFASIGRRGYTVSSISGDSFGITVISTNDETYCIWDSIEVYDLGSPEWVVVDDTFTVYCHARLMYDGHILSAGDSVIIDGDSATWNGTYFIVTKSYPTSGDRLFSVNAAIESTYAISILANAIDTLTHVTDTPSINDIESSFAPNGGLYQGVFTGTPLWIHWDPVNDPTPPSFDFTITGAYIMEWTVTSSWSALEILRGSAAGSYSCNLESGLPYASGNYTYTIWVSNQVGYTMTQIVHVFVNDYVAPEVNEPPDVTMDEDDTGLSIIWIGTDIHPDTYEITQDGVPIASGSWNSSSESLTVLLDGLSVGDYTFVVTLNDTSGNSVSDSVVVTIEEDAATTTSTPPTTTNSTTTTTTNNGTPLTIVIVSIIGGVVIVIVIIYMKRK